MSIMKLPGKHRNNATKSNRVERKNSKREPIVEERAFITKVKNYLMDRIDNGDICSSFVQSTDLQSRFGISECEAKKTLHKLEKIGFISLRPARRNKKSNSPYYNVVYRPSDNIPNNILSQKFGSDFIILPGVEAERYYEKENEFAQHNMLKNIFNREKKLIINYKGWAESWNNIPALKKPVIFNRFVITSYIISCHFLHVCGTLSPKERQKLVTKIKGDSNAALWAYFNCKISNNEKISLLNSIIAPKSYLYLYLMIKNVVNKRDREIVLNRIISENDIYNDLLRIKDAIIDTDLIIIAKALQKIDNQELAFKVNNLFNFNDNEKDYFAHLVIAYKMSHMFEEQQ